MIVGGEMDALIDAQAVAAEAFATPDAGRQIEPFSSRLSSFNLDDACRVTAAVRKMREARGERPVGRKIGFTNPTVWTYAPIWGYVYNRTVDDLAQIGATFSLMDLAEPRIEPEIVFRLAVAPTPGMDERALLASVDWVAHGFEIVDHGRATNVLGGPVSALRYLIDMLVRDRVNPPLAAGEVVTTGTLTRALTVSVGETWTTELTGVALDGISVPLA